MRIIGGLVGWMSPWAKILGGGARAPLHEVGAYGVLTPDPYPEPGVYAGRE